MSGQNTSTADWTITTEFVLEAKFVLEGAILPMVGSVGIVGRS